MNDIKARKQVMTMLLQWFFCVNSRRVMTTVFVIVKIANQGREDKLKTLTKKPNENSFIRGQSWMKSLTMFYSHLHDRKIQIQGFSLTSALNCLMLGQHSV